MLHTTPPATHASLNPGALATATAMAANPATATSSSTPTNTANTANTASAEAVLRALLGGADPTAGAPSTPPSDPLEAAAAAMAEHQLPPSGPWQHQLTLHIQDVAAGGAATDPLRLWTTSGSGSSLLRAAPDWDAVTASLTASRTALAHALLSTNAATTQHLLAALAPVVLGPAWVALPAARWSNMPVGRIAAGREAGPNFNNVLADRQRIGKWLEEQLSVGSLCMVTAATHIVAPKCSPPLTAGCVPWGGRLPPDLWSTAVDAAVSLAAAYATMVLTTKARVPHLPVNRHFCHNTSVTGTAMGMVATGAAAQQLPFMARNPAAAHCRPAPVGDADWLSAGHIPAKGVGEVVTEGVPLPLRAVAAQMTEQGLPPVRPALHTPQLSVWLGRPAAGEGLELMPAQLAALGRLLRTEAMGMPCSAALWLPRGAGPATPPWLREAQAVFAHFTEPGAQLPCNRLPPASWEQPLAAAYDRLLAAGMPTALMAGVAGVAGGGPHPGTTAPLSVRAAFLYQWLRSAAKSELLGSKSSVLGKLGAQPGLLLSAAPQALDKGTFPFRSPVEIVACEQRPAQLLGTAVGSGKTAITIALIGLGGRPPLSRASELVLPGLPLADPAPAAAAGLPQPDSMDATDMLSLLLMAMPKARLVLEAVPRLRRTCALATPAGIAAAAAASASASALASASAAGSAAAGSDHEDGHGAGVLQQLQALQAVAWLPEEGVPPPPRGGTLLVVPNPGLLVQWQRELARLLPGAGVYVVESLRDFDVGAAAAATVTLVLVTAIKAMDVGFSRRAAGANVGDPLLGAARNAAAAAARHGHSGRATLFAPTPKRKAAVKATSTAGKAVKAAQATKPSPRPSPRPAPTPTMAAAARGNKSKRPPAVTAASPSPNPSRDLSASMEASRSTGRHPSPAVLSAMRRWRGTSLAGIPGDHARARLVEALAQQLLPVMQAVHAAPAPASALLDFGRRHPPCSVLAAGWEDQLHAVPLADRFAMVARAAAVGGGLPVAVRRVYAGGLAPTAAANVTSAPAATRAICVPKQVLPACRLRALAWMDVTGAVHTTPPDVEQLEALAGSLAEDTPEAREAPQHVTIDDEGLPLLALPQPILRPLNDSDRRELRRYERRMAAARVATTALRAWVAVVEPLPGAPLVTLLVPPNDLLLAHHFTKQVLSSAATMEGVGMEAARVTAHLQLEQLREAVGTSAQLWFTGALNQTTLVQCPTAALFPLGWLRWGRLVLEEAMALRGLLTPHSMLARLMRELVADHRLLITASVHALTQQLMRSTHWENARWVLGLPSSVPHTPPKFKTPSKHSPLMAAENMVRVWLSTHAVVYGPQDTYLAPSPLPSPLAHTIMPPRPVLRLTVPHVPEPEFLLAGMEAWPAPAPHTLRGPDGLWSALARIVATAGYRLVGERLLRCVLRALEAGTPLLHTPVSEALHLPADHGEHVEAAEPNSAADAPHTISHSHSHIQTAGQLLRQTLLSIVAVQAATAAAAAPSGVAAAGQTVALQRSVISVEALGRQDRLLESLRGVAEERWAEPGMAGEPAMATALRAAACSICLQDGTDLGSACWTVYGGACSCVDLVCDACARGWLEHQSSAHRQPTCGTCRGAVASWFVLSDVVAKLAALLEGSGRGSAASEAAAGGAEAAAGAVAGEEGEEEGEELPEHDASDSQGWGGIDEETSENTARVEALMRAAWASPAAPVPKHAHATRGRWRALAAAAHGSAAAAVRHIMCPELHQRRPDARILLYVSNGWVVRQVQRRLLLLGWPAERLFAAKQAATVPRTIQAWAAAVRAQGTADPPPLPPAEVVADVAFTAGSAALILLLPVAGAAVGLNLHVQVGAGAGAAPATKQRRSGGKRPPAKQQRRGSKAGSSGEAAAAEAEEAADLEEDLPPMLPQYAVPTDLVVACVPGADPHTLLQQIEGRARRLIPSAATAYTAKLLAGGSGNPAVPTVHMWLATHTNGLDAAVLRLPPSIAAATTAPTLLPSVQLHSNREYSMLKAAAPRSRALLVAALVLRGLPADNVQAGEGEGEGEAATATAAATAAAAGTNEIVVVVDSDSDGDGDGDGDGHSGNHNTDSVISSRSNDGVAGWDSQEDSEEDLDVAHAGGALVLTKRHLKWFA